MATCACAFAKEKVIFDTDMGNDVDDALAQAILLHYADKGEAEILCEVSNKPNKYSYVFLDVVNNFYGFADIPIGYVNGGFQKDDGYFIKKVSEMRNSDGSFLYKRTRSVTDAMPDAVTLLRKTLASQPDGSVVYISTGFFTNLDALLNSKPDEFSALNGRELIAKKIKYISAMAGNFSAEGKCTKAEYNIFMDKEASTHFIKECPVPIYFSGFEVGLAVRFPQKAIDTRFGWAKNNPVVDAYKLWEGGKPHNRPSWDLTSVLFVFDKTAFDVSKEGYVEVVNGQYSCTRFTRGEGGKRYYLILPKDGGAERVVQKLIETASAKPSCIK